MSSMLDLQNLISNIDEQLVEVTGRAAAAKQQAAADREEMHRYLLIGIGPLHLAIGIDGLSEVGPLPTITPLPNLPPWIQGIVNIRSEIVSVVDFCGFLKMADRGPCNGDRLAVLSHKKRKVGIRVDRIIGTVHRAVSERKPLELSDRNRPDTALFTSGLLVEPNFYYLLDVPEFLTAPRLIDYNGKG